MATFPTDGAYPLPAALKTYIDANVSGGSGPVSSSSITDATTIGKAILTAANAAAVKSAIGVTSQDVGAWGFVRQVTLGSYPPRGAGTNPYGWIGADDPTVVTTPGTTAGGGGYVDGVDFWLPANVV